MAQMEVVQVLQEPSDLHQVLILLWISFVFLHYIAEQLAGEWQIGQVIVQELEVAQNDHLLVERAKASC